ncbi:hypothetical protein PHJA_000341900 [Phtheirospermum japonicum]|uniref:Uncharacterized protein n=1 Tax=Phtheirospermum japonicum TaxID=374723 RepID=A0A830B515_9LAMI|nr:hypothetical protein PHJA_000341900 [Phtheirospermum japonicum]
METLVVVSHHRDHHQCYGRNRGNSPVKFNSHGKFSGISCRTFQSGSGLLPTPFKNAFSSPFSPKTPSPCFPKTQNSSKRHNTKSRSMPIPIKFDFDKNEGFNFSERWAGPAYSNSPPPSSLPLPKFSLPPKRTVSLDFPKIASEIDVHPIAKSAPSSPTRACSLSPDDLFDSADSATKTLRRILNLDV